MRAPAEGFGEDGGVLGDIGDASFFGEYSEREGELRGESVEEVDVPAKRFFA